MRNVAKVLCGLMLAVAFAAPAMAETKIISIRIDDLVQASPQFKAGQAQLKNEFEKRKNELEAEAKKLQDDYAKYQKEKDLLSADANAKQAKDLQTRKIDFDYRQQQFGQDIQKRDRELSEKLFNSIKSVVMQVAKEKGADLVLRDPVFASDAIDVTDEILKRLSSSGGAGASP